ncbi:DUF6789 family protein [Arhodomonas aquaeolei]|uniref:DUF6789 family protein n=1 Tax=Arhodomonas aquaeolei TaxID=2369 RepID=UPI00037E99AD|nr:DUF6789 family protein [Arhodomonas aquaeolei]
MKTDIGRGLGAGLLATIALSVLMVLKAAMGMMPAMNAIKMLTAMSHQIIGTTPHPLVGWVIHLLIGTVVWGGLFALVHDRLPGSSVVRGLVFGTAAWLLMMVLIMPMAGAGLFGLGIGIGAPVATLVLHWVYGGVLGYAYAGLAARDGGVIPDHG